MVSRSLSWRLGQFLNKQFKCFSFSFLIECLGVVVALFCVLFVFLLVSLVDIQRIFVVCKVTFVRDYGSAIQQFGCYYVMCRVFLFCTQVWLLFVFTEKVSRFREVGVLCRGMVQVFVEFSSFSYRFLDEFGGCLIFSLFVGFFWIYCIFEVKIVVDDIWLFFSLMRWLQDR